MDDMREEVIRGLECCIVRKHPCGDCVYFVANPNDEDIGWCDRDKIMRNAIELLKEQEQNAGKWISVKDKMPGNNNDILIYGEWTGQSGTKYREICLSGMDDFIYQGHTPIAWMPIPEPPKEET